MAWRIIKQPNGLYAKFSDPVDHFTFYDASREEAVKYCQDEIGLAEGLKKVERAEQIPERFVDELKTIEAIHGLKERLMYETLLSTPQLPLNPNLGVKARDIVRDWPRGTSSSKLYVETSWALQLGKLHWGVADTMKLIEDEVGDREYHEGQARMMEEYRAQTGPFALKRTDFAMVGFSDKPSLAIYPGREHGTMQLHEINFAHRAMFAQPEDPQIAIWRERILAGWEKYGISGQPLDPRTVEHLAREFAKPIEFFTSPLNWEESR